MAIQALIPYALAAYGGYRGYKDSKDQGITGINRLLNTAIGAYGGYSLGTTGLNAFASPETLAKFRASQPAFLQSRFFPQIKAASPVDPTQKMTGFGDTGTATQTMSQFPKSIGGEGAENRGITDILLRDAEGAYDPVKIAALAGGIPYLAGAFDQAPVDIYSPGYNVSYLEVARQRGNFKYIDPDTGQEKEYQSMYKPEEQGLGDRRIGAYSMPVQRLKIGGIAAVNKFNEGGVNYLPSKMTHDENDSTNYVRASGYVEDGAGVGDKDEDTMLAQLADGEFVTRADGVLGAGIIAGANPNSMKDMREKGAQYFYEQQRRYKRVFDLLKEANGNSKQKEN